jgi:hypothetical protein
MGPRYGRSPDSASLAQRRSEVRPEAARVGGNPADTRGMLLGRRVLLCLGVVLASLAPATAAHARPVPQTIVQDDAELLFRSDDRVAQDMRQLRALGVDRVRLNAGWSSIAPEPDSTIKPPLALDDPNSYPRANWRRLDRAVRAARAAGLEVMIDIGFWAPRWATPGEPSGDTQRYRWDVDPAALSEFTAALVKRYSGTFTPEPDLQPNVPSTSLEDQLLQGPLGSLIGGGQDRDAPPPPPAGDQGPLPKVSWWTIWNEPNHPGFLLPQYTRSPSGALVPHSPDLYRRIVQATEPVIKSLQPDSTVLIGGLASFGAKNPGQVTDGIPPLQFVRQLACVDRKLRPLTTPECRNYTPLQGDGFAHHPYSLLNRPDFADPGNPDSVRIGALNRLTDLLTSLARAGRISPRLADLYLTEFGYETNPPDPQRPYSPADQARFLSWSEYLAWKNPHVRSWPQFLLRDLGVVSEAKQAAGARPFADYQTGLEFEDGTPKPSTTSFRLAFFAGCETTAAEPARKRKSRHRHHRRHRKAHQAKRRRHARAATVRRLVLWGHIRPRGLSRRVVVEQSRNGTTWRAAATAPSARAHVRGRLSRRAFTVPAGGVFVRYAEVRRGLLYRLRLAGTRDAGVATKPVPCGLKPELVARQDPEY